MRTATMGSLRFPNFSILLMIGLLKEARLDADAVIAASDVPRRLIEDPQGEVTGLQELAFQRAFHAATHDRPDLWVELGGRYRLLSFAHAAFGLALTTARNLQELFETSAKLDHMHYTLADAFLIYSQGQLAGFGCNVAEVPEDLQQFTLVRDFASNSPIFKDQWGGDFPFTEVESGVHPRYEALLRPLVNIPVRFGAPVTRWLWPAEYSGQPLPNSNALMHERYRRECQALIDAALNSADIVSSVEALLRAGPEQPGVGQAAERLGMSVRTLQRRLSERGMDFRRLSEMSRYRQACGLLETTAEPIAVVAANAGYENVSAFNHAFKRRSGLTPGAYRRVRQRRSA